MKFRRNTALPCFSAVHITSLFITMAAPLACAQLTWNSAGPSNVWSVAAGHENWLPGNVSWTPNSDAIFAADPESITVAATNTVFDEITFGVSGFTIANSAGTLRISTDSESTINVTNSGETATISETLVNGVNVSNVAIPGTITKAGAGTLVLTANNTFSGGLILSAGTISTSNLGGLGTGPVTNNGIIDFTVNGTYGGLSTSMSGSGIVNTPAMPAGVLVALSGDYSTFTGIFNLGAGTTEGSTGKARKDGLDNSAATINLATNATLYAGGTVPHKASIALSGGDIGESFGQLRLEGTAGWAGNISLTGAMAAGDATVGTANNTTSNILTISGLITETGGSRDFSKGGSGSATIALTNSGNNFTGALRIFRGNVSASSVADALEPSAVGAGSLIALGLNNGSPNTTFRFTGTSGGSTNRSIVLARGSGTTAATQTIENSVAGQLLTLSSPIAITGEGTGAFTFAIGGAGDGLLSGGIPGDSDLGVTKTGLGTWTLSGINTNTGPVIINAGILSVASIGNGGVAGNLGAASNINANLILGGGTLRYTGGSSSTDRGITLAGTTNSSIDVSESDTILTWSGAIADSALGLTKSGSGTLELSGVNLHTGATVINEGVLSVASMGNGGIPGNIGAGSNHGASLVLGGGTLRYTGGTDSTDRNFTLSDSTASTIEISDPATTLTISGGSVASTGSLIKSGPGRLNFDGSNAASGDTTVAGGILGVNGASINDESKLVIAGGTVAVSGIEIVDRLFFGTEQKDEGTYGGTGSNADNIEPEYFSGTGFVRVMSSAPTGYSGWVGGFGLEPEDHSPEADPDHDGFNNLLEYVLGGNPATVDAAAISPVGTKSGTDYVLEFERSDLSEADTTLVVEYGDDLVVWGNHPVGTSPGVAPVAIQEDIPTDDLDTITVTLSTEGATKFFARLKVVK